jgi:heme/copper-type cytochrome/quinol oxidase subunit 3
MVGCNPFQIFEFYDTSSCDLENEDAEEPNWMKNMGLMLFFLLKDIDGIHVTFILIGILSMTWMMMVLGPKL